MLESDKPAEPGELCGARDQVGTARLACKLPKGHVKTMDDWHEDTLESQQHATSNRVETTITATEHVRWAPDIWEVPKSNDEKLEMS